MVVASASTRPQVTAIGVRVSQVKRKYETWSFLLEACLVEQCMERQVDTEDQHYKFGTTTPRDTDGLG